MDFQTDTTQRQPLLSQSDEEIEYQEDDGEEVLETPVGKYTVLEKLLAFACGWLLLAMCIFAYLYQHQGGGHNHGGPMDMSQFEQPTCMDDNCVITAAQMIQSMNTSADPCGDFYAYTCGNSGNSGNSDKSIGRSPDQLSLDYISRNLLNPYTRQLNLSADDQRDFQVLDRFYDSCVQRNASNLTSLDALLDRLNNIVTTVNTGKKSTNLSEALGYLASNDIFPFFKLEVTQSLTNTSTYTIDILQASLTLPSILDYKSVAVVDAFKAKIREALQILAIYGVGTVQRASVNEWVDQIALLETKLANISETPDQLYAETVSKTLYSVNELDSLVPLIDWPEYFGLAAPSAEGHVYVRTPDYFQGLQNVLVVQNSSVLHAYLTWQTLLAHSNAIPMEARKAIRAINRDLAYAEDELCERTIESVFGPLIGDYFPLVLPEGIQMMEQLFLDIKRALAKALPKFGWIDRMASGHAIQKLEAMTMEIGHRPGFTRDLPMQLDPSSRVRYDNLQVTTDYVENAVNARRWKHKSTLALLDRKINDTAWPILPQDVQMYYQAISNKLFVPAGALLYYQKSQPDFLTYGQLGVQMAEQIIRACDAVGSHFDSHGKLGSWWSEVTREAYSARRQCLVSETNDAQTLEQILIQQAGMQLAYRAWTQRLQDTSTVRIDAMPGSIQALGPEKAFYVAHGVLQCERPALWLNEAVRHDRGFLRIYQCSHRNEVKVCSSMWA